LEGRFRRRQPVRRARRQCEAFERRRLGLQKFAAALRGSAGASPRRHGLTENGRGSRAPRTIQRSSSARKHGRFSAVWRVRSTNGAGALAHAGRPRRLECLSPEPKPPRGAPLLAPPRTAAAPAGASPAAAPPRSSAAAAPPRRRPTPARAAPGCAAGRPRACPAGRPRPRGGPPRRRPACGGRLGGGDQAGEGRPNRKADRDPAAPCKWGHARREGPAWPSQPAPKARDWAAPSGRPGAAGLPHTALPPLHPRITPGTTPRRNPRLAQRVHQRRPKACTAAGPLSSSPEPAGPTDAAPRPPNTGRAPSREAPGAPPAKGKRCRAGPQPRTTFRGGKRRRPFCSKSWCVCVGMRLFGSPRDVPPCSPEAVDLPDVVLPPLARAVAPRVHGRRAGREAVATGFGFFGGGGHGWGRKARRMDVHVHPVSLETKAWDG
jgi:hypothetical protein